MQQPFPGVNFVDIEPSLFDTHGLKEAEEAYRFVLRREPDNMDIRVGLAWCLLLQALYQSGQETVTAAQRDPEDQAYRSTALPGLSPGPDARHLLQECLRHSLTVRHLSSQTANQWDMEKLEGLVFLAGGKDLLQSNEEGGERIRNRIVRALQRASDQDNSSL